MSSSLEGHGLILHSSLHPGARDPALLVALLLVGCGARTDASQYRVAGGATTGSSGVEPGEATATGRAVELRDDWPAIPSLDPDRCESVRIREALPPDEVGIEWSAEWSYQPSLRLVTAVELHEDNTTRTHYEQWNSDGHLVSITYGGDAPLRREFVPDDHGNTAARTLSRIASDESFDATVLEVQQRYEYLHQYEGGRLISTEFVDAGFVTWVQYYKEDGDGRCQRIERDWDDDGSIDQVETFEYEGDLRVEHDVVRYDSSVFPGGFSDETAYSYDAKQRWIAKDTDRSGDYWGDDWPIRQGVPEFIEERFFDEDGRIFGEEADLFNGSNNSEIEWQGAKYPCVRYRRVISPGCKSFAKLLPESLGLRCQFNFDEDAFTRWIRQ